MSRKIWMIKYEEMLLYMSYYYSMFNKYLNCDSSQYKISVLFIKVR